MANEYKLSFTASEIDEKLKNCNAGQDWNQVDENAPDYIKNKPFYDNNRFEWVEIFNSSNITPGLFNNAFIIKPYIQIKLDKEYKVIMDGKEYVCIPKEKEYEDGFSGIAIGGEITGGLILYKSEFVNNDIPFHIVDSNSGLNGVFLSGKAPANLQIYIKQTDMKLLDRKFVSYLPGENTSGKEVVYDGAQVLCKENAEIYNDLTHNIAIGQYSHAEGTFTIAKGEASHAEGVETIASGNYSHTEGDCTEASGIACHAEGYYTKASGQFSHAEGYITSATADSAHAEGYNSTASGIMSHVEGLGTISKSIASNIQGLYNIVDEEQDIVPIYLESTLISPSLNSTTLNFDNVVYVIPSPSLNCKTGIYEVDNITEVTAKDLKVGDIYVSNNTTTFDMYYIVTSIETLENKIAIKRDIYAPVKRASLGKYAHIVGNGESDSARSNAHTLDWDGNAWYAGSVEATSIILKSSTEGSSKKFRLTITDDGELKTEEI